MICQISDGVICHKVLEKQKERGLYYRQLLFLEHLPDRLIALHPFIPQNNQKVEIIFIPILQVRFKEWKKLPKATQLQIMVDKPSFHHGLVADLKLFVSRLCCLLKTGHGLPAQASVFLLSTTVSLWTKSPRNSSKKLLLGGVLQFERMGRMELLGQEIRKQHQQNNKTKGL